MNFTSITALRQRWSLRWCFICVFAALVFYSVYKYRTSNLVAPETGRMKERGPSLHTVSHQAPVELETTPETFQRYYEPLPLWEQVSIHNRTCQPPIRSDEFPTNSTKKVTKGLDVCCIGSQGSGYDAGKCNMSSEVYERSEQLALASVTPLALPLDRSKGATAPTVDCDWCRMVDILIERNWTMALMGDSVAKQSFVAAECELRRRQIYRIEKWGEYLAKPESDKYTLRARDELLVTKRGNNSNEGTAVIRFYFMYKPDLKVVLNEITSQSTDILIFSFGLHYNYHYDEYETETTNLFRALLYEPNSTVRRHPWKVLAYRETSAQHFDSPWGGYMSQGTPVESCLPINFNFKNYTATSNARRNFPLRQRAVVERVIERMNATKDVLILDFWNYSSQFHELHPTKDCTHYCHTPSFWLYLWRQMRNAIDVAAERRGQALH